MECILCVVTFKQKFFMVQGAKMIFFGSKIFILNCFEIRLKWFFFYKILSHIWRKLSHWPSSFLQYKQNKITVSPGRRSVSSRLMLHLGFATHSRCNQRHWKQVLEHSYYVGVTSLLSTIRGTTMTVKKLFLWLRTNRWDVAMITRFTSERCLKLNILKHSEVIDSTKVPFMNDVTQS